MSEEGFMSGQTLGRGGGVTPKWRQGLAEKLEKTRQD